MKLAIATVCLFALFGAFGLAGEESPFAGTWKLNQAKSHLTGDTMKFTDAGSGAVRMTAGGLSYTFKIDGKAYPTPYDTTVAWKQLDGSAWELTIKKGDKVLETDTCKLSSDGKTINFESKGTKPDGESFDDTSVYERTAGQSGLLGTWKSKQVNMSAPAVLEMKASGADGMAVSFPDYQATCDARFDGKDYPATGPTMPDALTLALTRTGPHSFRMLTKMKGKPVATDTFSISADGKTLTDVSTPVAVHEPQTYVYERQ